MKSPVLQTITAPLMKIEKCWREQYEAEEAEHQIASERAELEHQSWREQTKQSFKKGHTLPPPPSNNIQRPTRQRLLATDATYENLAVDAPLPTYEQWCDMFWPFRNFRVLPPEEKRRLITSRFQEIRVKDYRVVSLFMLTGEAVTPEPRYPERDPNACYSCGRKPRPEYRVPLGGVTYCLDCSEGMAEEEEEICLAHKLSLNTLDIVTRSDTYQGLQPLRYLRG